MSFVNIKEYNRLKDKVGELEARIQSLEGYGAAISKVDKLAVAPAPIPTIEEAVLEPHKGIAEEPLTLGDLLDDWIRNLLVQAGYSTIQEVGKASDDQLTAIPGIGKATVKRIREALEG